jgi:hypothetical protein
MDSLSPVRILTSRLLMDHSFDILRDEPTTVAAALPYQRKG